METGLRRAHFRDGVKDPSDINCTPLADACRICNNIDMTPRLDREEYIEQAYFFRTLRERIAENVPTQTVLEQLPEELLSITRLPIAVEFLATEIKHTGLLSSGFQKLPHYFTPFQTFVVAATEDEQSRFSIDIALLILEREAKYRSGEPTPAGLFVYQFEALSRNRLGYDPGLSAMKGDAFFDQSWREFFDMTRRQVGVVDFGDLVFVRSELYVREQRRQRPDYVPPAAPLFGEKEGKIARANRGRDPLYLFAALQRQLGYPEVPRARPKDDPLTLIDQLREKLRQIEQRLQLVENEQRGSLDLTDFLKKPDLPDDD